jgi:hypothetical protein
VNEPVLIVRPDDGPIGRKQVALYVFLMVIIDVLDKKYILCLNIEHIGTNKVKISCNRHKGANRISKTSPIRITYYEPVRWYTYRTF